MVQHARATIILDRSVPIIACNYEHSPKSHDFTIKFDVDEEKGVVLVIRDRQAEIDEVSRAILETYLFSLP